MSAVTVALVVVFSALSGFGFGTVFGFHVGRRHVERDHDQVWVLNRWNRMLTDPVGTGGRRSVPCPYCGISAGHAGTCRLSLMRTGQAFVVYADASWPGLYSPPSPPPPPVPKAPGVGWADPDEEVEVVR